MFASIATTRISHTPAKRAFKPTWRWPLPKLSGRELLDPKLADDGSYVLLSYDIDLEAKHVPVLASNDGIVTYAARGCGTKSTVCLDHCGGWSSQYGNLDRLVVAPQIGFAHDENSV